MLNRIKNFFAEARQELRHVNWPTRDEAMRLTAIVIGVSISLALFLGLFDFIFAGAVKNIVLQGNVPSPGEEALTPEDIEVSTEEDGGIEKSGEEAGIDIEPL